MRQRPFNVCLEAEPGPAALHVASRVFTNVASRSFLRLFEPELSDNFHLGEVRTAENQVVESFQTVVSPNPLVIRGGPKSRWNRCDICGRFRYLPAGDLYVLKRDLTSTNIYDAFVQGEGLVLTPEYRNRIERGQWKGLTIGRVPVLDEPQDGIDEFPDDYL